jgi:hypothetical protein
VEKSRRPQARKHRDKTGAEERDAILHSAADTIEAIVFRPPTGMERFELLKLAERLRSRAPRP